MGLSIRERREQRGGQRGGEREREREGVINMLSMRCAHENSKVQYYISVKMYIVYFRSSVSLWSVNY